MGDPTGVPVAAHNARPVADLVKQPLPVRRVMVYPKASAVRKLDIAPEDAGGDDEQIIEAVDVPVSRNGARAVVLLNKSTGQANTIN